MSRRQIKRRLDRVRRALRDAQDPALVRELIAALKSTRRLRKTDGGAP